MFPFYHSVISAILSLFINGKFFEISMNFSLERQKLQVESYFFSFIVLFGGGADGIA